MMTPEEFYLEKCRIGYDALARRCDVLSDGMHLFTIIGECIVPGQTRIVLLAEGRPVFVPCRVRLTNGCEQFYGIDRWKRLQVEVVHGSVVTATMLFPAEWGKCEHASD